MPRIGRTRSSPEDGQSRASRPRISPVLPPRGQAATYVYPFFDKDQPPLLLSHLPGSPRVENVPNSHAGSRVALPSTKAHQTFRRRRLSRWAPSAASWRSTGADLPAAAVHPGDAVRLTLHWRALQTMADDYTMFVHADDSTAHRRLQRDSMPCAASFGTSHWTAGEQVGDDYTLQVPPDAPDGAYTVTTGVYKAPELRNLKVDGKDATDLEVGSFKVAR